MRCLTIYSSHLYPGNNMPLRFIRISGVKSASDASLPDASAGIKAHKDTVRNCRLAFEKSISLSMFEFAIRSSKGIVVWMRAANCQSIDTAAADAVLCGDLGLPPATGLAARLRPVKVSLWLGDDVLRVTALETLSVIAIHVPRQFQVSSTPGTCLELYHFACSFLSPLVSRICNTQLYVFITPN